MEGTSKGCSEGDRGLPPNTRRQIPLSEPTGQILANSGQILVKVWSNTRCQIGRFPCPSRLGHFPGFYPHALGWVGRVKNWSNTGQMLVKYWSNTGQIMVILCLGLGRTSAEMIGHAIGDFQRRGPQNRCMVESQHLSMLGLCGWVRLGREGGRRMCPNPRER
jgi:hypothetical protein